MSLSKYTINIFSFSAQPAMFLIYVTCARCLQEIHLDKHIKLLDCPGIVMATSTSDAGMILRNCVKIEQLVDPLPPVEAILRRCSKTQVDDVFRQNLFNFVPHCSTHLLFCIFFHAFLSRDVNILCGVFLKSVLHISDHGSLWSSRFSHSTGVLGIACPAPRQTEEGGAA